MDAKRYSSHANYSQEVPRQMTGSHLAAHFGLEDAMKELLMRGRNLNLKDSELRTSFERRCRGRQGVGMSLSSNFSLPKALLALPQGTSQAELRYRMLQETDTRPPSSSS